MTVVERGARPAVEASPVGATVDRIVDALQDRISEGDLTLGTWIRQERIAAEFGVSRMPVREALRRLEALGIVELVPNRGARVTMPSVTDILDAFEVRSVLEGHAAFRAARDATREMIDRLRSTEPIFEEAAARAGEGDVEASRQLWYRANALFHATVIEAAGSSQLAESVDALHHRIPRGLTWSALQGDPRLLMQNAETHRRITEAIDAGDGEEARRRVAEHGTRASELVVRYSAEFRALA
ncbi:GntR family transcriptional regulator [Microbacterium oleivorans]|uniref:GntR family transcriptional regulator n=1 Tax=Microbacterium oleivorans TaxID=273677 RepID=A0A7D5J049_9MICO|nr:GntR family transcriptional regulator [Microbacterium oleivorans]QLD12475.1 GntR family transcriptional regulator [Microbacterium oleivorans]